MDRADTAAGDTLTGQVIVLDHVEVVAVRRWEPRFGVSSWPCPSCGARADVGEAWCVRVRNRRGPAMERDVVICGGCRSRLTTT